MPVQFTSIKEEHNAVRYEVGMFDVSHMGEISIKGNENISTPASHIIITEMR